MSARLARILSEHALLTFLLVLLGTFLLYPIWLTVKGGFVEDPSTGTGFTFEHIALIFEDPTTLEGLINAGKIAVATTILSAILGVPLAVLSARHDFPLKKLLNAAILVPLILPPFVGAIGMKALLGREGALHALLGTDFDLLGQGRFWGVVIVQALHLYPIIYLNAVAALANLDPALSESAENLGASRFRRFFTITLPLIRPGLFAGGTIVLIWAFTELGTPLIFDYYAVTPVQIFYGLKEIEGSARPYALTVVLLAVSVVIYAVGKLLFGQRGHAMQTRASRAGGEAPLTGPVGWLATLGFAFVSLLAVVPHLGVVLTSVAVPGSWYDAVLPEAFTVSHFETALSAPDSFNAIRNSLGLSSAAVVLNVVFGLAAAYLIARTRVRGRSVLDAMCMLPLAVPGLVMAFGYVALSLRPPFDGVFDVVGQDPNPFPLLIIAYAVRRLPYIVRSAVAGLEQTSGDLEEAAMNLGATRLRAIRAVVVPLILANIIAGALLVFSFSMLEVSDSLLLAQRAVHYPITKMIFALSERLGDGPYIASAMGVWGMGILTVTLVGASLLLGRKLGAVFRV